MPYYSYATVKETGCLTENDKERLLAVMLSCDMTAVFAATNWDKAAADFGSKSVDSMRVMTRTVFKKIEKVGGKSDSEPAGGPSTAGDTPKGKTPKARSSGAKKAKTTPRKRSINYSDSDDEEDQEAGGLGEAEDDGGFDDGDDDGDDMGDIKDEDN